MVESDVYFRASVGILVLNGSGLVLALERSDVPGAWQAPQGGVQVGEQPVDAARRELREETGLRWSDVSVIDELRDWLAYELPVDSRNVKTGWGQVQKWFLVRLDGIDEAIDLRSTPGDPEFTQWRWMPFPELILRTWEVRRPVYYKLASYWSQHFA